MFRKMKLERIVSRQRHVESLFEVGQKRRARELQEELVVADGRHADPDVAQIIQVLKHRRFSKKKKNEEEKS